MYINFIADAQNIFKEKLESKGIKLKHNDDAIISWFTYCERLISRRQRKILKAKEFSCPYKYKEKLKKLEQCIEKGVDLTPYLSRGIMDCGHDDLMLYDWGIYHLHVSDELDIKKDDGFMKRSALLLYVLVRDDSVYFIKTVYHNEGKYMWAKKELMEIIYDNWAFLLKSSIVNNISKGKITDMEKKVIRDKHGNSFVYLKNGIVLAPPNLGAVADGTSLKVVIEADRLKGWLENIQKYILKNIGKLLVEINAQGIDCHKIHRIKLLQINNDKNILLRINDYFKLNLIIN